jgi:site-specific DNA recombinase
VVQRMFALCASGLGPSKIARILKQEQIVIPTVYDYRQAGTGHAHLHLEKPYEWSSKTVSGILEREEYIGTTVNCRGYIPSFKSKKQRRNGGADKILDYAQSPKFCLYSRGIIPPSEHLIRFSRYHII